MMIETGEAADSEIDLILESDEDNYSVLRDYQRKMLRTSARQEHSTNLAQSGQQEANNNQNTGRVHAHAA